MASSFRCHECHRCETLTAKIIKPSVQASYPDTGLIHSESINLGTLAQCSDRALECDFYRFFTHIYDQVRIDDIQGSTSSTPLEKVDENIHTTYFMLASAITPIAPSGKRIAWSNYVDFVRDPGKEQQSVVPTRWRAAIRLLVDDISAIGVDQGYRPVELGRRVTTMETYDSEFVRSCYETCLHQHGEICRNLRPPRTAGPLPEIVMGDLPGSMRVIDVIDGNILQLPGLCEYAILSYVWGQTNSLRLSTSNLEWMEKTGSLYQSQVPRTILHAMVVTKDLGLRYLWVDSVCIIQDSIQDKQDQIHKMDKIYRNATITIVDGLSSHADGGLWSSEPRKQIVGQGGGLRWIAAAPTLLDAINLSHWNKRAWTFQEGAFSRRMLFFSDMQVYYSCRNSAWTEDYVYQSDGQTSFSECSIDDNHHLELTVDRYRSYPTSLSWFMNHYTARSLTFEDDVLNAAAGVLSSYLSLYNDVPLCGLSTSLLFEWSLLWVPATNLRRRQGITSGNTTRHSSWPSWTWAGWVGAVQHKSADHQSRATMKDARVIDEWRFEWNHTNEDNEDRCNDLAVLIYRNGHMFVSNPPSMSQKPLSLVISKITSGCLRFKSIVRSFDIESIHWNQIMGSRDIHCQHTGYYKIFDKDSWIGSVHTQHDTAKRAITQQLKFIVLSKSGDMGPEYLMPLPHKYGRNEDDDQVFVPLCDEGLFRDGDDEMYNVMLVEVHRATTCEIHCERLGIGQIHRTSFSNGSYCQASIVLY